MYFLTDSKLLYLRMFAFLNQIPIVHYEGGDVTSGGTFDDKIRHAISQISDYHLVTNKFSFRNLKNRY